MKKIILLTISVFVFLAASFIEKPILLSQGKIYIETLQRGGISVQTASLENLSNEILESSTILAIELVTDFDMNVKHNKNETAEYFEILNESFVSEYLEGYSSYYASLFTPFIFLAFDEDSTIDVYNYAITLESLEQIKKINIYNEIIYEPQEVEGQISHQLFFDDMGGGGGGTSEPRIPYDFFPSYTSYSGDGVTIGIIDVGTMDVNHANFTGNQPTIVYDNYTEGTIHPTVVASVLGGQHGIAPDANLVYSDLKSNGKTQQAIIEEIVSMSDIVNMSVTIGDEFSDGAVDTVYEAFFNDLVINSGVTIIASTGNRADVYEGKYIGMPALAANVIAVGSIDDEFKPAFDSNFENANNITNKPNIVAVGEERSVTGLGVFRGTSLAAPAVAGALALKFEKEGSLNVQQVLTMLSVTANDDVINKADETLDMGTYDPSYDMFFDAEDRVVTNHIKDNGYRERTGAGALDISELLSFNVNNFYEDAIIISSTNYIELGSFYASSSDNFRVSVAWLQKTHDIWIWDWFNSRFIPELSPLSDFDLSVWGPTGNLVLHKFCGNNNAEMSTFIAISSGYYTVKIKPYSNYSSTQYIDFAYLEV
ncbi:MAG: S8/S53 family peptidase [Acholeplasmataceae bacterium]|nr:S8/S53 family peptidase [Acholeplasmataceae bacterium]